MPNMGTRMVRGAVVGVVTYFCKNTGKYPLGHVPRPNRTAFFTDISVFMSKLLKQGKFSPVLLVCGCP